MKRIKNTLLTCLLLAGVGSAQESVWTVGFGAGFDFSDLQTAIDSAADGDVLLLKDSYHSFDRLTKSLTIEAEMPGTIVGISGFPFGSITQHVGPLGQASEVVFRNIAFVSDSDETAIRVEDSAGSVLFEKCSFDALAGLGDACVVVDSRSVTFMDCELEAGGAWNICFINSPRIGLFVDRSTVFVYDTDVRGSGGGSGIWDPGFGIFLQPGDGGDGAVIRDSELFSFGSTFTGGRGGRGAGPLSSCGPGADGGDGLVLLGSTSAFALDSSYAAGSGGSASGSGCPDGRDGAPLVAPPGSLTTLVGTSRSLSVDSPVAEGTVATLTFQGEPGDEVVLYYTTSLRRGRFYASFGLALHLGSPIFSSRQGTIPANGVLQTTQPLPYLAPGRDFAVFAAQALFTASDGSVFHSGPSHTLILDESF